MKLSLLLFLALLVPLMSGRLWAGEANLPTLTTAEAVRQLSAAEAQRGYPVRIEGVVLYYRQGRDSGELIVRDDTLGIFARVSPNRPYALQPGDRVELEGVSDPGKFAPMVILSRLQVRGHGPLPVAREVSYERLLTGAEDSQWVKARGIIHSATNATADGIELVHVDLAVNGGRILVRLPRSEAPALKSLIGAEVTVTGACATIFNNRRQLLSVRLAVQSLAQLVVETPAPADPAALPLQAISTLHQYNSQATPGHLVKVQGIVLFSETDKSVFIRDGTQAIWVQAREARKAAVGDQIEVVGFPASRDYSPILEDAIYRKIGSAAPLPPIPVVAAQARKGELGNDLVQIEARLLDAFPSPAEHILVLQADNVVFRASLAKQNAASFRVPPLRSWLRLSGICVTHVDTTRWPQSFHLLLRSPDDVQVLSQPPGWTVAQLLWALGAMAALCIAAACWVMTLRRRVRHQTEVIEEKIRRTAVLEERTRIARDFHDSLEQQLAAIALQIQVVRSRFESSPELARQVLQSVDLMLRHTRSEARHSVWELRSRALEEGTLGDALARVAAFARNNLPIEVEVRVSGQPRPLTGPIENNLLRIGQEAATNAVKHGQARHVQINLNYDSAAVQLSVEDDGQGFELESAPAGSSGHFGLLGMRERAEKIGGHLQVTSAPGRGARIGVIVPLPELQPAEKL
jgi:signal transduction histidine kinase